MITTKDFKEVLNRIIPYDSDMEIVVQYDDKIYKTYEVYSDTGHDICFKIAYTNECFNGVLVGEVCTLIFMTNLRNEYFFDVLIDDYTTMGVKEIEYRSGISSIVLKI